MRRAAGRARENAFNIVAVDVGMSERVVVVVVEVDELNGNGIALVGGSGL